ncbi:hypothetical protein EBR25_11845, partial [bacterium]|nr:hypothetical protein [bacterium]
MESTLSHSTPVAGKVNVVEHDGVYTIFLGSEEERVITITSERMASLKETIAQLKSLKPKGVIISGPRENMFAAGADINAIQSIQDPLVGEELGKEGQAVFQMIEDLSCPTVAAVSGPCVGGGCELALSCDFRLISTHPSSQIGLPETKLGILPGWGGTQRLPRLIGIQKALSIILPGKTLKASQAKKYGLVDEVLAPANILARADAIARRKGALPFKNQISLVDKFLTYTWLGRHLVERKSQAAIMKETRGNYPAQPAALQAVLLGLSAGTKKGYAHEAAELGRLLVTQESRSLVNLFFLTEGSKRIGKAAKDDLRALNSLVVGAGVMGAGIAGAFAQKNIPVILKDTELEALERGKAQIARSLEKKRYLSGEDRTAILERIRTGTENPSGTDQVNIVVEAIVEKMDVKKAVLGKLAAEVAPQAILCTNTSSLSVSELSEGIAHPERVVGMHFFNPVEKMPLVEIVRGKQTDDRSVVIVAGLTTKLGKFPIIVEDVPGFLVNRILSPYLNEAGALLEEGYRIQDIDRAAQKFGMPMGPIRLLDEVGLDVAEHVAKIMVDGYGERMKSRGSVGKLVEKGLLGKKSRKGFYEYSDGHEVPNSEIRSLLGITNEREVGDPRVIEDRLIMSLINEGIRCLDEGVAGIPGKEAANQIDLGTVMGIGFPPFRGGLISYANSLGAKAILEKLRHL